MSTRWSLDSPELRALRPCYAPARRGQLVPEGTGTRLKLTHEGFDLDSPMARQAFDGMKPGWPQVLVRLDTVLHEQG